MRSTKIGNASELYGLIIDITNARRDMVRRDPLLALMTAELASQRGDFVSANIAYTEAARSQKDPELAKRAVEISLGAGDVERALTSAKVWQELSPQDAQAERTVLLLLLSSNRVEEGYPALEATYKQLKEQESAHPGIAEASPLRIALDQPARAERAACIWMRHADVVRRRCISASLQCTLLVR